MKRQDAPRALAVIVRVDRARWAENEAQERARARQEAERYAADHGWHLWPGPGIPAESPDGLTVRFPGATRPGHSGAQT